MEATVYSKDGKASGKVALPDTVFNAAWNADLVHEVVTSMQGNARSGSADVKDRSDVRGGGKKPWKQKGTGRARHGSRRSPIWSGGGIAHGPTSEKRYGRKINRNARAKALASVLSKKYADGEVVFVDALPFESPKASDAKGLLISLSAIKDVEALGTKKKNAALVVVPARDIAAERSFQNFGNVETRTAKDVNPVDLLTYKYVIVAGPEAALPVLTERVATKKERAAAAANA